MAETSSTMLSLGTALPEFRLSNAVDGKQVSSDDFKNTKGLLVMFICNHCPFVIHIREQLVRTVHGFLDRGIAVVAINSNSVRTHPQDGPDAMRQLATKEGWRFPYLFDESQAVAKAFRAACTPDFYLFDGERKLVYRGQFDDSRPGNKLPVTGSDLKSAVAAVLDGAKMPAQKASIGCNIKWAPGNAPEYFS